ncbi:MAG: hypothetical protein FJY74_06360 [Candidatus Eisenbacteria bacterium]|nr:hypothetical protein [Candidatus Eisenbacteria bacterium]
MKGQWRVIAALGLASLLAAAGSPAEAQIEDQLSAYTGVNAEGYLQPLVDAIGTDLNGGLFHSARVPVDGFHLSLEIPVVAVLFADDDAFFEAQTEDGFSPETAADAPTIVGPGEAVVVTGDHGTSFAFPGGFDLNSFALAVPQLRIGSIRGTEALVRYIAINTGDVEIGNVSLIGFGLRHNINQYFGPEFPVDVAGGFFWQSFTIGEDLLKSKATSFGVQASRRFGTVAAVEPYMGLSLDTFGMDVAYESEASGELEDISFSFDTKASARLTLGVSLSLSILNANAEYTIAGQNGFAFGVSFGM